MTTTNLLVRAAHRVRAMSQDPVRQDLAWREAAGLPRPPTVLDVLAALDEEQTPDEVLEEMVKDPAALDAEWLEERVRLYQRARQVQRLRADLEQAARNHAGRRRRETATAQYAAIAAPIDDALTQLAALSKALPEGASALRPEASIDASTTEQLAEVRRLLDRIGAMLGSLPQQPGHRRLSEWALALIDVPMVEPARVLRFGTEVLNPSPARDAIVAACEYDDLDRLVVDISRGALPPLNLRIVEGRNQVVERAERVQTAHLVVTQERL